MMMMMMMMMKSFNANHSGWWLIRDAFHGGCDCVRDTVVAQIAECRQYVL